MKINEKAFTMKKRIRTSTAVVSLAGLLSFPLCHAEPLPLWEIGAGVAPLVLPDYRGSDMTSTYVLPIPYFIYRGEFLKADRNGLRSTLIESQNVEINISVNGTLPVNSKNNPARRGMADLEPTIEIGPTARVNLWNAANQKMKLDFHAPLRTSITVESSPRQIGWLFSPGLNLNVKDPAGFSSSNLGLLAGPIFSSRKYNSHFYSVSPSDATAARPAYAASGGYSGSQFTMTLSKRFPRYWIGGFMRYDTLAGAVFDDSPLVKKRSAISVGIAIACVFNESSRLVNIEE
jgi:outer membrane protein